MFRQMFAYGRFAGHFGNGDKLLDHSDGGIVNTYQIGRAHV